MTPPTPATPHAAAHGAAEPESTIARAARGLGQGPLTEEGLVRHVHPLFSRTLERREIYLANHSLGRPLDQTAEDIRRAVDLWYTDMDGAWGEWMGEITRFRRNVARLIGLHADDGVGGAPVVPKPGAGQGLRAVLNALPNPTPNIVATRGEFDSIDFILKTYHARARAKVRWIEHDGHGFFHADQVIDHLDDSVDLVVVSQVFFSTGQVLDGLDRIIEAAGDCGALVLVDMYHSAGVLPGELDELEPDFAIGGSYKYTRGGPGAGWLAVHPRHLRRPGHKPSLVTLDTGWFAKGDVFGFSRSDDPAAQLGDGATGWMECTPIVLTAYQAKAGLELSLALGVERLRAYNLQQQSFLLDRLAEERVPVRAVEPRGAFLLLPHERAPEMTDHLRAAGVNTDARTTPDGQRCVRVCPDILNTRDELARAAAIFGREWARR